MRPKFVKLTIAYENDNLSGYPKVGSIYKVTRETSYSYGLEGLEGGFAPYRFEVVGCPCSVSGCLTHKEHKL